ncbi:hypothetical protein [Bradyrhizobium sp. SRS-191]|uniref:hypothetical protein n=1 Tax=Bradyrhizobium sp. SRS-191 TaxID=2962606 RepID=UPI00211E5353|nr:hypothetical protein [Bradyrhizobium sp. SRS-191]
MFDYPTQLLGVCLISYAIAVLMPSWRALAVATLLLALATTIGALRDWWTPAQGGCSNACTLEDLLDIPLLPIARAGFITGAIVRALTFLPQARSLSPRAVVLVCLAGSAAALAILVFAPSLVYWRPLRIL